MENTILIIIGIVIILLSINKNNIEGFYNYPGYNSTNIGSRYRFDPRNKDNDFLPSESITYGRCTQECESQSPMYQSTDPFKCMKCSNCGLCELDNGEMICMSGNAFGPHFHPLIRKEDCKCWYHGSAKGCWPHGKKPKKSKKVRYDYSYDYSYDDSYAQDHVKYPWDNYDPFRRYRVGVRGGRWSRPRWYRGYHRYNFY